MAWHGSHPAPPAYILHGDCLPSIITVLTCIRYLRLFYPVLHRYHLTRPTPATPHLPLFLVTTVADVLPVQCLVIPHVTLRYNVTIVLPADVLTFAAAPLRVLPCGYTATHRCYADYNVYPCLHYTLHYCCWCTAQCLRCGLCPHTYLPYCYMYGFGYALYRICTYTPPFAICRYCRLRSSRFACNHTFTRIAILIWMLRSLHSPHRRVRTHTVRYYVAYIRTVTLVVSRFCCPRGTGSTHRRSAANTLLRLPRPPLWILVRRSVRLDPFTHCHTLPYRWLFFQRFTFGCFLPHVYTIRRLPRCHA